MMRAGVTATVAALLALLAGKASATSCERVCSFDAAGMYRCMPVCVSSIRPGPAAAERQHLCRKRCGSDLRACRAHVDAIFACPKRAGAVGRSCRQATKRALRSCRSEVTTACMVWSPRPHGCPGVALEAGGAQRLANRGDPGVDYLLIDVVLRSRGDAEIARIAPHDFALITSGETSARYPMAGLAGLEYCQEDVTLPANGTVACRLAYQVPSGASSAAIEFVNDPYRGATSLRVPAASGPVEHAVRLTVRHVAMLSRLGGRRAGSGGDFALLRVELLNAGFQPVLPEARHFRFEVGTHAYPPASDVADDEIRAIGGEPCPGGRSPLPSGGVRECMLLFRIPLGTDAGHVVYDDGTHRGASTDTDIPFLSEPDRSQSLAATLVTSAATWNCAVDLTHVPTSDGPAFLLWGPCTENGAARATLVLWGPVADDGRLRLLGRASALCDLLRIDAGPLTVAVDDPDPLPTGGYVGMLSCTSASQTTDRPFTALPR